MPERNISLRDNLKIITKKERSGKQFREQPFLF